MAAEEEQKINDILNERVGINETLLSDQQDIANVILDQVKGINFAKIEQSNLRSITRDLSKTAQSNYTISLKELGTKKLTNNLSEDRARIEKNISNLEQIKVKELTKDVSLQKAIQDSLDFQVAKAKEQLVVTDKLVDRSEKIGNNFGVDAFQGFSSLAQKIPGLSKFSKEFATAADAARISASKGATGITAFGKGLASAAKSIGPLLILTEIVKAFTKLDAGAGEIGKQLGVSYQQSLKLQGSLSDISTSTNNIFLTTENLRKSFLAINQSLGLRAPIDKELLKFQTQLVEQAGYSVEAATTITQLSAATGQDAKELTTEFLGQAAVLRGQTGILLSEKQLLESINKLSGQTLATFAAQPKALAASVFAASKLGLELSQVEKIADGLLNIESSLTSEFEAEVLLGRQLNLERARFFALTNDLEGVANELTKQGITQASFADMNRIQQQAAAAALNMSADEMGKMLIEQKAMTALSGIEGETVKEKFNNLVKEVGLEQAKKDLGDEALANQLASVTTQEKFAQTISKLQEVFVSLVDPLLPILSIVGDIASIIGGVVRLLDPVIKAISSIITLLNPFSSGADVRDSITRGQESLGANWLRPLGIVEDGMAPASKGPFTITDNFGATAITAQGDGLAVSPNIIREESINVTPNIIREENRNTTPSIDYDQLANAIAMGAERGTSRANITTNLDGSKVSNRIQAPLAVNTRKYSV